MNAVEGSGPRKAGSTQSRSRGRVWVFAGLGVALAGLGAATFLPSADGARAAEVRKPNESARVVPVQVAQAKTYDFQ